MLHFEPSDHHVAHADPTYVWVDPNFIAEDRQVPVRTVSFDPDEDSLIARMNATLAADQSLGRRYLF